MKNIAIVVIFFLLLQINFAQPAEALHNFIRGNDKVRAVNKF